MSEFKVRVRDEYTVESWLDIDELADMVARRDEYGDKTLAAAELKAAYKARDEIYATYIATSTEQHNEIVALKKELAHANNLYNEQGAENIRVTKQLNALMSKNAILSDNLDVANEDVRLLRYDAEKMKETIREYRSCLGTILNNAQSGIDQLGGDEYD